MNEQTKTLADRLGEFLVALAGEDRGAMAKAGEDLRRHLPMPTAETRLPPIASLTAAAVMLRHYELGSPMVEHHGRPSRGPDGHAFGAARLAIEMRLEQILEGMMRPQVVSLVDPAERVALALGMLSKEVSHG